MIRTHEAGTLRAAHAGEHVVAGEEIAKFTVPSSTGIETGWAAGPGRVIPKAATLDQESHDGDPGDNRTYCGNDFSQLLAQLGAPPGATEGRPVVGSGC